MIFQLDCDPSCFGCMGFRLIADELPAQAIHRLWRERSLGHTGLQGNASQRGFNFAIGRQFVQTINQPSRNAHQPGAGMIEVDPLETCRQSALDWLHQHGVRPFQQVCGLFDRNQQPVGNDYDFVGGRDESRKAMRTADKMKSCSGALAVCLQLHQIRRHFRSDTDEPLAIHHQRERKLVPSQAGRADSQECARQNWPLPSRNHASGYMPRRLEHR